MAHSLHAAQNAAMRFDEMPVAPGGEGLLGHNADFRNERMAALLRIAAAPHRIMRLRLPFPGVRAVMINDPDVIQEALVEKAKSFSKSAMLRFSLWNLGGEGLFTANGDLWKRQRKLLAPLFTPRALEAYADDMIECAERTVATWRDGEALKIADETTRLTMAVAGKTLFGADTFGGADELGAALTTALGWTGWIIGRPSAIAHIVARRLLLQAAAKIPTGPTAARVRDRFVTAADRLHGPALLFGKRAGELARAIEVLDAHVQSMIDERRRAGEKTRSDLLARLLEAKDEDGTPMSDRQVRDEVLTLFVAGHETTATGLAWTLYYACKNPAVYSAMEREADAVGDAPSAKDLPRLETCLRAFKEAMRVAPPVYAFGRDSIEPVTIDGYELKAPTNTMVSPFALHHSSRIWPNPERFDPDRFRPELEARRHRYAYLPFGAGPRICIGSHFAHMEAQLALGVLLRRFRFELLADDEPVPGASLRPKHGIVMRVTRRIHAVAATSIAT